MKKMVIPAVLVLCLLIVPAHRAAAAATPAAEAIKNLATGFVSAWNVHDPKKMAMAFAEDANLINPFDVKAKGRAEIEKLFVGEQTGVMKASTYTIESTEIHQIARNVAVEDFDAVVTGMAGPDGKAIPPFKHHVTMVCVRRAGKWEIQLVRAFLFAPKPAGD